jgi:hypothetical protein
MEIKSDKVTLFIVLAGFYLAVVSGIDRFSHPELTETELFMRLPSAVMLDFSVDEGDKKSRK